MTKKQPTNAEIIRRLKELKKALEPTPEFVQEGKRRLMEKIREEQTKKEG